MTLKQLKDKEGQPFSPKMPVEEVSVTKLKPSGVNYTTLKVYRCGNVIQVYVEGLATTSVQSDTVIAKGLPTPVSPKALVRITNFSDDNAAVIGTQLQFGANTGKSNGYIHLVYLTNQ